MKILNVILAVSLTITSIGFAGSAADGTSVMSQNEVAIELATTLKIEGRTAQKMSLDALELMSSEQRKQFLASTFDNIGKLQVLVRSEKAGLQAAKEKALANNTSHITYNIISHPMFYVVDILRELLQ